jgi:hypothetical protein
MWWWNLKCFVCLFRLKRLEKRSLDETPLIDPYSMNLSTVNDREALVKLINLSNN